MWAWTKGYGADVGLDDDGLRDGTEVGLDDDELLTTGCATAPRWAWS
jgi:hypothetical protein